MPLACTAMPLKRVAAAAVEDDAVCDRCRG
jgi:hypothetical protein